MRNIAFAVVTSIMAFACPGSGIAHHSPAGYDQTVTVLVEGVVRRFEWASPHVYIFVEQRGGAEPGSTWEIEAPSPSLLTRSGWSPSTFSVGESVVVRGAPSRQSGRRSLLFTSIQKADGSLLTREGIGLALSSDPGAPEGIRSEGMNGTWVTLMRPVLMDLAILDPDEYPVTPAGLDALRSFDEASNPGAECVPIPPPFSMLVPDLKIIETAGDRITIRSEQEGVERIVFMDQRSPEGMVPPANQGLSIGRWEGDVLVVETRYFAPNAVGNARNLPSGEGKRLVERFRLNAEGRGITYRFELEDPEYLAAPITGEVPWVYRPDLEYRPGRCDPENARRFAR